MSKRNDVRDIFCESCTVSYFKGQKKTNENLFKKSSKSRKQFNKAYGPNFDVWATQATSVIQKIIGDENKKKICLTFCS